VQKESVQVELWRDGAAHSISRADGRARWSRHRSRADLGGALLQAPHRELAAQRGIEPGRCVRRVLRLRFTGDELRPVGGSRIVEVDGHPVRDLDAFIAAVSSKVDRDSVRVTAVQWNGAPEVTTLKLDNKYWPAYELRILGQAGNASH
jgi:hypothetical protein